MEGCLISRYLRMCKVIAWWKLTTLPHVVQLVEDKATVHSLIVWKYHSQQCLGDYGQNVCLIIIMTIYLLSKCVDKKKKKDKKYFRPFVIWPMIQPGVEFELHQWWKGSRVIGLGQRRPPKLSSSSYGRRGHIIFIVIIVIIIPTCLSVIVENRRCT